MYARNGKALDIVKRVLDPSCRQSVALEVALLDSLDELIGAVELFLDRTVKVDDADMFYRLRSIPGVGKILALVLLWDNRDPAMPAYATGPDLDAAIARPHGDPA